MLFRRAEGKKFARVNLFLHAERGWEKCFRDSGTADISDSAGSFFFGVPPGDTQFSPPSLPTWLIGADETYGMPNLETRGFKVAIDGHGERVDPDTQSRVVSAESVARVSAYVAKRFPALRNAPVVETRVCQYENTSNGDFLIDRQPEWSNVWFAGGGSGHGFKHGPMVGEYVAQQLLDGDAAEPRFALANKATEQKRAVY